jgi:hypothetical protein
MRLALRFFSPKPSTRTAGSTKTPRKQGRSFLSSVPAVKLNWQTFFQKVRQRLRRRQRR